MDGQEEVTIISTLTSKASGVFLWATIATSFLLQGLDEDDDFLILKDRADALPYILDDLLAHVLNKLEPEDLEVLWKLHTLLESAASCPGILELSFALTSESAATFAADVRPLQEVEVSKRVEDMHALLLLRCNSLLSVFDTTPPAQHADPSYLKVTYTHRAIRDYFLAYPGLLTNFPTVSWSPTQQWANSHLWVLKTLAPPTKGTETPLGAWGPLSLALEAGLGLYAETKKFPLTYMDAALTTAVFLSLKSETGSDLPQFPATPPSPTTLSTCFDLAVLLNLAPYLALKVKTTDRKDIRHAIDFSHGMRKRLGAGGEDRWLGARGREKLRAEYNKSRTDVDALLEYYAKAVRFGTAKPVVEPPEYV
jgi:hypothetical protein